MWLTRPVEAGSLTARFAPAASGFRLQAPGSETKGGDSTLH